MQFSFHLTFEACWMKTCSSNLDMFSFNLRIAADAGIVHVIHVVLLAVHLAIQLIIGAFYRVLAYAADTLAQLLKKLTKLTMIRNINENISLHNFNKLDLSQSRKSMNKYNLFST